MRRVLTIHLFIISIAASGWAQYTTESDDFSYPVKLYDQKFYDLAAQQFVKFYSKYPQSSKVPEAKYYAGMSYYKNNKFDQARIEFQSLALEYPQSARAPEGWYLTGNCNEQLHKYDDAAKSYQSIRLLYPEHSLAPDGLYQAAKIQISQQDYKAALVNLNVIFDRYSTSSFYFPALVKGGEAHIHLNELQQAKYKLNKALEGNSDSATKLEAQLNLAIVEEQQGNIAKAKSLLENLLEQGGQSEFAVSASLKLSRLLMQEKNYEKARQYLSRQTDQIADEHIRNEFNLLAADLHFLGGQYGLAFDVYQKTNDNLPDSLQMIVVLKSALSLKKQGLDDQAIEMLKKSFDLSKRFSKEVKDLIRDLYLNWLEEAGQYEQSLSLLYDQVNTTTSYPEKAALTLRIALILEKKGNYREMIRELQPFIIMQDKIPEKDDILYSLAYAYEKAGDYDESIYLYRRLSREFSASQYYDTAVSRIQYLQDYKLISQDSLAFRMAELMGLSLLTDDRAQILFELGKMYYAELKDYKKADTYFQNALDAGAQNTGDIYLYLGKTHEKMAGMDVDTQDQPNAAMISQANAFFKKAVENIATCSTPDEASWLMVESAMLTEKIPNSQLKKLIDHLIQKYPNSLLKEKWLETLAFALAFDDALYPDALEYFRQLVTLYPQSENHPAHLFGLARLLEGQDKEQALDIYREIALDYSSAPQAAQALEEVASYYENNLKYQEANLLYSRLLNNYFYSQVAQQARQKLGEIYTNSGDFDKTIRLILSQIVTAFMDDYMLLQEFTDEQLYDNLYYLARAYSGSNNMSKAVYFYKLYVNIAPKGAYRDKVYFDLGELYYQNHQEQVAEDYFRLVAPDTNGIYVSARVYMAEINFDQQDYKQAAMDYAELKKLIHDEARQPDIYGKHIVALLRAGEHKTANKLIAEYKKKFGDEKNYQAQFLVEYGKYYRANKDFSKAIKLFNEVKKKYKSSKYADDADYFLALTYLTLNKTEDAYKILSEFYTNYPGSDRLPAVYNSLGSLYFRGEKYDDAINMFKNALQLCKERDLEMNIMSNLIKAYSFTGFWDAAMGTARQYVKKFPDATDRLSKKIIIGRAYTNLNQFQNAVDYLRQIKMEADSETEPEIQFYIGNALLKAGRYEDAIAEFVKIPFLSKKTKLQWEASALYYSGQAYEKLGRIHDAVRMYDEIVKRPGIDAALKAEAQKRIKQIQG